LTCVVVEIAARIGIRQHRFAFNGEQISEARSEVTIGTGKERCAGMNLGPLAAALPP